MRPSIPEKSRAVAVCFDLDGVLVDTMPLHAAAWRQAARAAGLPLRAGDIYRWEGEPGTVTARRLARRRPALAAALLADKERRLAGLARRVRVLPAWARVLQHLHASRVPLALVTGTSRREVLRIMPVGTRRRFRVIVTGDRVRHGKPHPEPYRMACRRLRVSPARAVVVENAPYGIRSAKRAGAGWVIAVASSLPAQFLREADEIARGPQDVLRRLMRRLGAH